MTLDLFALDYVPPSSFGPAASLLLGVFGSGLGGLGLLALVHRTATRLRRDEAAERAAFGTPRPPTPGPQRIVKGIVETDAADGVALGADVRQRVQNHSSKNGSFHTWEEIDRLVVARPFRLRLEDGEVVLVEPPEDVVIATHLTTADGVSFGRRTRLARIRQGDEVRVSGELEGLPPGGAYRASGRGLVLRAPRRGRMIVATAALEDRYAERRLLLQRWGSVGAVLWTIYAALVLVPFVAVAFGAPAAGRLTHLSTYDTTQRGAASHHWVVEASTERGAVTGEVPQATWRYLRDLQRSGDPGPEVPTTLGLLGIQALGSRPSIPVWQVMVGLAALVLGGAFGRAKYLERRAWYDKERVMEYGGRGKYGEP